MAKHDLEELALAAETARTLVHEVNNFLNILLLQLAVIEKDLGEAVRQELAPLKVHGKKLALLIKQWQRQRRSVCTGADVDLNGLLTNVAKENVWTEVLKLDLAEALPRIVGPESLVRIVSELLLQSMIEARAGRNDDAPLRLKTSRRDSMVVLHVAEPDWGVPLHDPEEAFALLGDFPQSLALATARAMAQKLGGTISIDDQNKGDRMLALALPVAHI